MHSIHKFYKQKNIIITGGSKGIGLACARQLAASQANLILVARNKQMLQQVCQQLQQDFPGAHIHPLAGDITLAATQKRLLKLAQDRFGAVHGLINNAGFARPGYFEELSLQNFEDTMRLNYHAAVQTSQMVLPLMPADSFISFTSSVAGYMGVFGFSSYSPSKFALIGLAQCLRQELYFRGIHVAVLCPPDTDTPGLQNEGDGKPPETSALSESAKLMDAETVASRFLKKLARKKFMINVNFESQLFYALQRWVPEIVFKIMIHIIKKARRKL